MNTRSSLESAASVVRETPKGKLLTNALQEPLERAHEKLQHLYEVSKLLTKFESVEETVPGVVTILAEIIPLRSVVLILDSEETRRGRILVWGADDIDPAVLPEATKHARNLYTYLVGPGTGPTRAVDEMLVVSSLVRTKGAANPPSTETGFILLPLVRDGVRIFGAVLIEAFGALDETDLAFVSAVLSQVAIAIDRKRSVDAVQLETLARQADAERASGRIQDQLTFIRAITGSLGEGVLAVDREMRITFMNPVAKRLLRSDAGDVIETRVSDVLRLMHENGDEIAEMDRPLERALRTGESVRGDDCVFMRVDGTKFPVSLTAAPIVESDRTTGAVLVFQDILDLQRSERTQRFLSNTGSLLASSLDYRATVGTLVRTAVPLLGDICFVDELGGGRALSRIGIAFADPRVAAKVKQAQGYDPPKGWKFSNEQVLRSGVSTAVSGTNARCRSMMIVPLLVHGKTLGTLTLMTPAGERYDTRDLTFAEDIGRRVAVAIETARLYAAAQQAVRARQELLAVVSHDLKNPLAVIMMSLSLLTKPVDERRKESTKGFETVRRAVDRMSRLLGDLVDLAGIEAGNFVIETDRQPVAPLVKEAYEIHKPIAVQKGVLIDMRSPRGSVAVMCDPQRVAQIFANLIGNAIKFTPLGGRIDLGARRRGKEMLFWVKDSGPGISPEEIPNVFERYWQTKKTAHLGTGLGLFIVKRIVRAHSGRVWVSSKVGEGSTFFFTIPIAAQPK